ncbi:ergothioneine biosynthesis glutamate--cysteine ligase EgtA [Streptomyces clavuligerus]|uniref:ergothioneine biosynthesis glutamate--cysteine ligase EgtA n=1 Tax=Streptomyces clavuligerus TaxID=1901 RepID=UPI000810D988|nr:ergothioneine biosynthesis glutamate--cysteine ligase EgtA [Streptomyces clavuligerus]ANW17034.1 ergothioneine biosynthesis glutamate--cysteine ligase EgtA [Streptomyces clavuligerus]AXU11569.1 ergothioneine biosynthesis glutamate--cysteine ligase EgtA [Streptomyces clavuligerus]MBY6301390.1 ergothioneine biosynthesis glutamate--cysteine ligase EgtA [Streptomyces clavuligerus]QPL61687.1 ergothioneine biosynthesis glutamate--cysteine ligase EgtA [Streptomyces clavuligerus]QPL67722.1 ergothio
MCPADAGDFGRPLTEEEAERLLRGICFKNGPPRSLGVELEWLVHQRHAPRCPVPKERLTAAHDRVRALALDSLLTFEPGGQVELSSRPAPSLTECVASVSADLDAVRAALDADGLVLAGMGIDPWQPPRRLRRDPRYDAMEAYLDRNGPVGRVMMCASASIQVCVDAGEEEPGPLGQGRRWQLAHLLGAVLSAAFANSPVRDGRRTGWRSTRQAIWGALDGARTLAPPLDREQREAWTAHALDVPVMFVRTPEGPWQQPRGLTFRGWLRTGLPRPPTRQDLEHHLSTLFPPVRPRGHLELRMIDAQSGADGWVVPLAVTAALFDDPQAAETAHRAVKPLAEWAGPLPAPRNPLWVGAARYGLSHPELRTAARTCFGAALEALPRIGASTAIQDAVAAFHERQVARGRCPADDLLAAWQEPERRPVPTAGTATGTGTRTGPGTGTGTAGSAGEEAAR